MPKPVPCRRVQSLRWRLLCAVCVAALLSLALSGLLSYRQAQHEAAELIDGHLAQSARLLLALVRDNEDHLADLAARLANVRSDGVNVYEPPLDFQVGRADGTLLLRSADAPNTPLPLRTGYSEVEHDGRPWRMLNLLAPSGDYRVQVSLAVALRDRAALEVAGQSVLPIALISPLLLLSIYYSIRRGLKPLDDLAAEVAARSPENLEPLANRRAPSETQPLVAALNRLLPRLRDALANERRFTADAAHELRTPLAIVKIQAQVAQLSRVDDDRQHALRQIVAGADRATRVVEQLLRLARLDPLARLPNPVELDLAEVARQGVADLHPVVDSKELRLQIDASPLSVTGDAELLQIALRNLLDNALRYTPPASTITVFARRDKDALLLGVADDGPGVPPLELPRLVERFYRGREANAEGSGLGLAIVQRIAELHDARCEVENLAAGGFEVRLRWNGSPAAATGRT
ncbi:ATP-binding protein [Accumulibacter sp.]|uniref:ATP-binding protein n=1 Tax=Accumulibacter sp. TaxID=2053492 RepID=UPI00260AC40D|nr:ATP-binding protein [Accumulibacter sp.]